MATGSKRALFKKEHPGGIGDNGPPHTGSQGPGISRPATRQCQNKPCRLSSLYSIINKTSLGRDLERGG